MTEKKLHDRLKDFLVEVGTKEGYKSFCGDSECLDIRLKKKRIEYKPDIVWTRKGSRHVFEIAFTEDWRAIVGEFTLAWLADCSSFTVFALAPIKWTKLDETNGRPHYRFEAPKELSFFGNLLDFLGKKFDMECHFVPVASKTARKAEVTDLR